MNTCRLLTHSTVKYCMNNKRCIVPSSRLNVGSTHTHYSYRMRHNSCIPPNHHKNDTNTNLLFWQNAAAFLLAGWAGVVGLNYNNRLIDSTPYVSQCEESFSHPPLETTPEKTMVPSHNDDNYYHPMSYHYKKLVGDDLSFWDETHALFGSLLQKGMIERFNLYKLVPIEVSPGDTSFQHNEKKKKEVAIAVIRIGKNLNGHKEIVHGGIIGLLFDETFGWAVEILAQPTDKNDSNNAGSTMAFTANLNIDYRRPLPADTNVVIRTYHEKTEGRKIYLSAKMESHDGLTLYSEASVLFIKVKKNTITK